MSCSRGCCASFAEHARSVSLSAAATPNRRLAVVADSERDRQLGRDMDAYRRLRREGLQPRTIDGAAVVEKRATESWQVEGVPCP